VSWWSNGSPIHITTAGTLCYTTSVSVISIDILSAPVHQALALISPRTAMKAAAHKLSCLALHCAMSEHHLPGTADRGRDVLANKCADGLYCHIIEPPTNSESCPGWQCSPGWPSWPLSRPDAFHQRNLHPAPQTLQHGANGTASRQGTAQEGQLIKLD
jgi:hypothetical protein